MSGDFFDFVSDFLSGTEGCEAVGESFGKLNATDVATKAQSIAEQKGWIGDSKNTVRAATHLMQYEFSKKLVWFVSFLHTQEGWLNDDNEVFWMKFALIKIDDETEEILFADFIKPQIINT